VAPNTLNTDFRRPFPLTRRVAGFLRREAEGILLMVGMAVNMTVAMGGYLLKGRLKPRHFMDQAAFVGWDTLGIALVMVTFSAMVIALQVAKEMVRQGAGGYVGALVSLAVLRELAPIMTAVAVISMAGSAFAAELSTMNISKQVEALRTFRVDPIRYLVLPRVMAGIVMIPLMTVLTAVAGILAGMVISHWLADVPLWQYLDSVWQQTEIKDVAATLFKSSVFGYIIVILSTTIGLNTDGGAKEVGVATTRAVVWSFLTVAIFDYILTYLIYGSQ
jgi:phospholipid/cholesterol/gamma-HCH transport system permease protein